MPKRPWDHDRSTKKLTSRQKSMANQETRLTGKYSDPMKFAKGKRRRLPEDDEF